MARRRPKGDVFTELILETFRFRGELERHGRRIVRPFRQTPSRWLVMGAIEDEAHTIPQIARRMGITRQGVQRVADELVREDLADLTDNPDHRRSPLLTLTAGGRRTLAQINRSQAAWSSEVAATFEYPDLEDAVRMLKAATRRLRDLEGWRGFKS